MSEATQTQSQSPTLEQTLDRTDFGHFMYENRKAFLILLATVLAGVIGYSIWKETKHTAAMEDSYKAFEFQSKTWTVAKEGKMTPEELVKAFEGLDANIQSSPVMVPTILEMSKFFYEKGFSKEADAVLAKASDVKEPVSAFFVNLQRSVILEKMGNLDGAITALEKINTSKDSFLPAKVGVELGRLYLLKGDKGKAQTQFENVLSTYPNDSEAKIAKLYLSQLGK
jgi:predicted negative regulator of RcsB-dependent stress response